MTSAKLIAAAIGIVMPFLAFSQATDSVSTLLQNEMITVMQRDGLLLSDSARNAPYSDLWSNDRQREKTIRQFDKFQESIRSLIRPPECSNSRKYCEVKGTSLYTLSELVYRKGDSDPLLNNNPSKYQLTDNLDQNLPCINISDDNAAMTFNSSNIVGKSIESVSSLNLESKVIARIKVYQSDTGMTSKHFQISYFCGTYENPLAKIAAGIIESKHLGPEGLAVVKDMWDKSIYYDSTDRILKSFPMVYVSSQKGYSTANEKNLQAKGDSRVNFIFFSNNTSAAINKQSAQSSYSTSLSQKIWVKDSKPEMQELPIRQQIQEAFTNATKNDTKIITADLSFNDDDDETISMQVGPISAAMYKMLEVDKQFMDNNLRGKYRGLFRKPVISLENADDSETRVRNLSIKISINDVFKTDSTTGFAKGEKFPLPLRIFYNNIPRGSKDTLVVYENTEAAYVKYSNYPIVPDRIQFCLVDTMGNDYVYRGRFKVLLNDNDRLKSTTDQSKALITRMVNFNQQLIDSLNIQDIITNLGYYPATAVPDENGNWYYQLSGVKIPKQKIAHLKEPLELSYEMNIMNVHKNDKETLVQSRRISRIILPIEMNTGNCDN